MERSILHCIQNEGLRYMEYVIAQRAIPHMMDGFKPVHRYIMYSALQGGNGFQKVASVGGSVSIYGYHHGEGSAEDAGSLLAAHWCNNVPLFDRDGFFGSRLVRRPGDARYIKMRVSSLFKAIYQDEDLAPVHTDPEHVPPEHYLPIIPMVLINGFSGIAKAYATNIPPHCPVSVIKGCIAYLKDKDFSLELKYPDFRGTVKDNVIYGKYELQGKTKLIITEIPPRHDREKYIAILDALEEKGNIVSYVDQSKEQFKYVVTLKREYANSLNDEKILKDFKLTENVNPNVNVIYKGSLRSYATPEDLLKDFVNVRLDFYQKRIDKRIEEIEASLALATAKTFFIDRMIAKPDALKGLTRDKATDFIRTWAGCENHAETLVQMNIYHLTTDEREKLIADVEKYQKQLDYWKATTPKIEYLNDLDVLAKKLK